MLEIGSQLVGRYQVESLLGSEPQGNVYIARDLEDRTLVAVKELPPQRANSAAFMWNLRHEAEALNQAPRGSTLRPRDIVEENGRSLLVMDYVPGMTLDELKERWPRTRYVARAWGAPEVETWDADQEAEAPGQGSPTPGGPGRVGDQNVPGTVREPAAQTPSGGFGVLLAAILVIALAAAAWMLGPRLFGPNTVLGGGLGGLVGIPAGTPAAGPNATFAVAKTSSNVRAGPGTNYAILTVLRAGARADIVGRSQDGNWWQLRLPGGTTGWIFANLVTVHGPLDRIQIAPLPGTK